MRKLSETVRRAVSVPLRLWRSRGFGVHSPYAFRFITDVLFCRHGYYSYAEIGSDRSARRLYRVLLDLAPVTIVVSGPLSAPADAAVSAARRDIAGGVPARPDADRCPKAVVIPPEAIVGNTYLRCILESGGAAIFTDLRDGRSAEAFTEASPHGMVFEGLRLAVVAGNPRLPRQRFRLMM